MLFYSSYTSRISRVLFSYLFSIFMTGFSFQMCPSLMAAEEENILLDWEVVPALFRTSYAPLEWKKQHLGWDLEAITTKMRAELFRDGHPTVATYKQTLRHFLASLHDYHVFPVFHSTEQAILPFSVMQVEGRYLVAWINRDHLPENVFRFEVGDELLQFDNKPVQECIDAILADCFAEGASLTDKKLATHILTSRSGARGDVVPQGLVSIIVRSAKTEAVSEYQIVWEYEDDILPATHMVKAKPLYESTKKVKLPFLDTLMRVDFPEFSGEDELQERNQNPLAMGKKTSFFPPLAEAEEYKGEEAEEFPFYAYTFKHPLTGKTIGFVRIPDYLGGEEEAQAFGELIEYFEEHTSALVIDQLNNPGGKSTYLSALASVLSPEPLNTPQHQFILTHKKIIQAYKGLQILKEVCSEKDAQELFQELAEEDTAGYPLTYQTLLMVRHFYAVMLKTWQQGKTLTPPVHVGGIDRIFPHPDFLHYSKPILLLINGLDFSGGDFMAAILQDSKLNGKPRATLFGERTAGAGGAVESFKYPNQYGVSKIAHTVSIAYRPGLPREIAPLENLGVTPDIPYTITQSDLQNEFAGYRQAILDALVPMTDDGSVGDEEDQKKDEDEDFEDADKGTEEILSVNME